MCLFRFPGWSPPSPSSCWLVHLLLPSLRGSYEIAWGGREGGHWSWFPDKFFSLFCEVSGAFPSCNGELLCFIQKRSLRNLLCPFTASYRRVVSATMHTLAWLCNISCLTPFSSPSHCPETPFSK